MTARAKAMRADGVDVLALSAGEPDFDTPENVKNAGHAALDRGETRYSPVAGTLDLRQAVADDVTKSYGRDIDWQQVIVGCGAKHVLFNACACLLDPGEEAIFSAPYWVSYPDMVRFAGAEPRVIETELDTGFLPTAEQLKAAINERTQLVILNSPSNPTGATYDQKGLEAIADVLRDHPNVFIISDDIYQSLVYDEPFCGLGQVAPDLANRTLIVTGVSKTYAMTGWRIGFGTGPIDLIKAMSRLQGASTSGANTMAQAAAVEALTGDQSAVRRMTAIFKERRDRIVIGLRDIPDVDVFAPRGAFYVFPRVAAYYGDRIQGSSALCEHLLESVHVAAVPGVAFGADDYVRLSFACSEKEIDEGLRRIRSGLEALR
ncbi:MAG: pyridoxal phosphate-dependent aminotransferase [Myxococcota bacterium]